MSEIYRVTKAAPPGIEPGDADTSKAHETLQNKPFGDETELSARAVSSLQKPSPSTMSGTDQGTVCLFRTPCLACAGSGWPGLAGTWHCDGCGEHHTWLGDFCPALSRAQTSESDASLACSSGASVDPLAGGGSEEPALLTGEASRPDDASQPTDGPDRRKLGARKPGQDRPSLTFLARSVTIAPDWRARLPAGVTVEMVERDLAPRAVGR